MAARAGVPRARVQQVAPQAASPGPRAEGGEQEGVGSPFASPFASGTRTFVPEPPPAPPTGERPSPRPGVRQLSLAPPAPGGPPRPGPPLQERPAAATGSRRGPGVSPGTVVSGAWVERAKDSEEEDVELGLPPVRHSGESVKVDLKGMHSHISAHIVYVAPDREGEGGLSALLPPAAGGTHAYIINSL